MSKLEKLKEEIGYLKVIFSILIAIAVSIIAWLFQNSETISTLKIVVSCVASILVLIGIIYTNKNIIKKINEVEDL